MASSQLEAHMIGANVIVDLSHHNGDPDLGKAKAAGIAGVIQKATQSNSFTDPTFARNRKKTKDAGLLFGAYHFGVGADGVEQADFFLNVVKPSASDIIVLDFEGNQQGPSMTLDEARAFVTHIHAVTGRWPGLYSGHFLKELLGAGSDPVLINCWLWLAQYGPTAVIPPAWKAWTMWQYTNGALGPEPVPVDGIGACDRDTYNGSPAELSAFWNAGGVSVPKH
jgi:lysozyme